MSKHTPGPWKADGIVVRSKFGGQICMFSPWIRQTADQLEDNIRLIAAAPEMLIALQTIASRTPHRGTVMLHEEELILIAQAIAKATGEQQ